MKGYFAYIRVSTVKQGEKGSSLQEQQGAIDAYARRHGLNIAEWFEEKETAAKQGRPVFARMLENLERGLAAGVITHKIDRSARNLRDWAILGELVDRGIELHFAHESIDLSSRGGRLSADIQAVVAADYVRNLRDEVKKGFYGRLKQGLYPLRAPIGYLDNGGGKPKTIDPVRGLLIAKAFELYATGVWSLATLGEELYSRGLRAAGGRGVSRNGLSIILNNSFYVGLIRIEKTGETFLGVHEPLIDKPLFDRVQMILQGRMPHKTSIHHFRYQRMIKCLTCGRSLTASQRKGHIYYRCSTSACPSTNIKEQMVDETLRVAAESFSLPEKEWGAVRADIETILAHHKSDIVVELQNLSFGIAAIDGKIDRLTDAYVDRVVDRDTYLVRKERLLGERTTLASKKASMETGDDGIRARVEKSIGLIKALGNLATLENDDRLRDLLKDTVSDLTASQKNIVIAWSNPFCALVNEVVVTSGGPRRDKYRTFARRTRRLVKAIIAHSKALETEPPNDTAMVHSEQKRPNSGARNIVEFNRRCQTEKDVEMHGSDDILA